MAYDYRNPDHAGYASYDGYHASASAYPVSRRRASRTSSTDRSQSPQRGQPVYDAVNNAFDKSDAASHLDPGIVAQITEEVRKQVIDTLKSAGQFPASGKSPPPKQPYPPESPATSATTSFPPRDVYTPPSPTRHESMYSTGGSNSPDPPAQDPYFQAGGREREEADPRYGATRPTSPPAASDHGSQYGSTSQHSATSTHTLPAQTRPQVTRRLTEIDETTIEKTWQPLFDADGQPTARLGQFLRGLALHLIDDYEPKHTLVVTPAKMRKFYDDVRVQDETYPWSTIFGALPNSCISKMYRDLRCQHHLVQDQVDKVPTIPALTPKGFQDWMILMIQGHPETEFERLSLAVKDMPISNADDFKERFPKELSRRLFPKAENLLARQRCAAAVSADGKIPVRTASFPPPPPTQPPYSYQPDPRDSAVASEDSDNEPVTVPIERERKPYAARAGGGKIYEDLASPKPMVTGATAGSATSMSDSSRVRRSQSNASGCTSGSYRPLSMADYPPSTTQTRQYRAGSNIHSSSRRRSPSFSTNSGHERYGTRSEPNVADIPTSNYASNIYSDAADDENGSRRIVKDAEPRWTDSNGRSTYIPGSQSRHSSIYDDDYNRRMSGAAASSYGTSAYGGYPPPPPRH